MLRRNEIPGKNVDFLADDTEIKSDNVAADGGVVIGEFEAVLLGTF